MSLSYPTVLDLKETNRKLSYGDRESILYALSVGFGADPLNIDELSFVYEQNLRVAPTFATAVAWEAGIPTQRLGVNYELVLHVEEKTIFHRTMPPRGSLIADSGVAEVYDRGRTGRFEGTSPYAASKARSRPRQSH